MKRILLIIPNSHFLDSDLVFPHLGILHLLAVAKSVGYKVFYINKKIKPEIENGVFYTDEFDFDDLDYYKDFDIVGISCTTPQANTAYLIKNKIKKLNPIIKIIIGGPHAKHYAEECLSQNYDLICRGDGEAIFKDILTDSFNCFGSVITSNLCEKAINEYPIPLRQKEYIDRYIYNLRGTKATTVVNSRGCPMKCGFCENSNTKCRWYSTNHFRNQIESILNLNIKGIMIFDDIFAVSPKKVKPYLEILKKYNKSDDLIFRCFGHAKIISKFPQLAKDLSDAGCVEMGFGAESASQRILNNVNKNTTVKEMHNFVNTVIENNINVKAFFMIGLPGETKSSANKTYEFIKYYKNKYPNNFDFDLTVFFPYKGTPIGDKLRKGDHVYLRLIPGYTWYQVDNELSIGAYKKKKGESDIIIESYDPKDDRILLSAHDIYTIKNKIMKLSKRYKDNKIYEGSI